jgi:hypothetical protein
VRADAAQSALCAYLSLIALAGLAINDIWRVKWADPIAALAVLPLIVWEGSRIHAREGLRLLLVSPASTQSVIISRNDLNCGTWNYEYNQQLDYPSRVWTLKGTAWDHHQSGCS